MSKITIKSTTNPSIVKFELEETIIKGQNFEFAEWEGLQTEQSFKYSIQDIEKLAYESGFEIVDNFYDSNRYFVDSLWQVVK